MEPSRPRKPDLLSKPVDSDAGDPADPQRTSAGRTTPPETPLRDADRTGAWTPTPTPGQDRTPPNTTLPKGEPAPVTRGRQPVTIGEYTILDELGKGGMGVVYRARDRRLNRTVALKMIRSWDDADERDVIRFRVEAEAVARMQHPGIVQIFEIGEWQPVPGEPPLPYFTMEYCPGGTLSRKLSKNPVAPIQAAEWLEQIARAIAVAHETSIVHRDLKPGNILFGSDDVLKVTDFGLAKQLDADDGQTRTGAVMGTPSYMAPEQAFGKSRHVGPAADIYALGAMLYEMATGRPPFQGVTAADVLDQVRNLDPLPLRQLQQSIPRDLETICLKCLRKDPEKRYRSAVELADDLERYLDGRPILARPVSLAERTWKLIRRRPGMMIASMFAVLFLIVGSIVSTVYGIRASQNEKRAQDNALQAQKNFEREQAERFRAEGLQKEAETAHSDEAKARKDEEKAKLREELTGYRRSIALIDSEFREHNLPGMRKLLESCPKPLRNWEYDFLAQRLRSASKVFDVMPDGQVVRIAYTPDGKRLVAACADNTFRILDAATGKELFRAKEHEGAVCAVAVSLDGKWAATGEISRRFGTPSYVLIWDIVNHKLVHKVSGAGHWSETDCRLVFRPNSRQLAVFSEANAIHFVNYMTGEHLKPIKDKELGHVYALAYSPDGALAISGGNDKRIIVWNADSAAQVRELIGHHGSVSAIAVSPDGKRVASGGGGADNTIRFWNLSTGKAETAIAGHSADINHIEFSPDGMYLASSSLDGSIRIWDVGTHQTRAVLRGNNGQIVHARFRPEGYELASSGRDGKIMIWDLVSGNDPRFLDEIREWVPFVAASPDGRYVAWIINRANPKGEHFVQIFDTQAGKAIEVLQVQGGELRCLAFSPDGRWIAMGGLDRNIYLFEMNSKSKPLKIEVGGVTDCITFSADSRKVAIVALSCVVFDLESKAFFRYRPPVGSTVRAAAFHPTQPRVATSGFDGIVRIWDAGSPTLLRELPKHAEGVNHLAYSPDGKKLVSASFDRTTRVWDAHNDQLLATLVGHQKAVRHAIFTRDSTRIFTASDDATIRCWDSESGDLLLTLKGHTAAVNAVALCGPNEDAIASASFDKSVRIWERKPIPFASDHVTKQRMLWHTEHWTRAMTMRNWYAMDYQITKMMGFRPDVAQLYAERGRAKSEQGRFADAVKDYGLAIDKGYQGDRVWRLRGDSFAQLAEWKKADADFAQAARLNSDPQFIARRLLIAIQLGDTMAQTEYRQQLLDAPVDQKDRLGERLFLCALLLSPGDAANNPTLRKRAEALLAEQRNWNEGNHLHALALYRDKQDAGALKAIDDAIRLAPASGAFNVTMLKALILKRIGRKEEADALVLRVDDYMREISAGSPRQIEVWENDDFDWTRVVEIAALRREYQEAKK
jgi:WD40 repeat protein/serine/threonine protein kinase/Flp pilus assembly protein TadD